jgi:hypothetical protein
MYCFGGLNCFLLPLMRDEQRLRNVRTIKIQENFSGRETYRKNG